MDDRLILAANLKKIRYEAGLTQEQLAEIIGIGHKSVSHWENGRNYPNRENLRKLLKAFPNLHISDELAEESLIRSAGGLHWRINEPIGWGNESPELRTGIELFKLIVEQQCDWQVINQMPEYLSVTVTKLRRLLKKALVSKTVELLGVERDVELEGALQKKYGSQLRQCIVAKLSLPSDLLVDPTLRTEAVAFLGAKEAYSALPNNGKVGLTGGTTIARLVDLIPYASSPLSGLEWVPLVATKPDPLRLATAANTLAARMAHNQPGTKAYFLPFVSADRRGVEYLAQCNGSEAEELKAAHDVLEQARNVAAVFMSVGTPRLRTEEDAYLGLGLPDLLELYAQMLEKEKCVGEVLLYLVNEQGQRCGSPEAQRANDAVTYAINLADLESIAEYGTVWLLSGTPDKASITHAALKGKLANCLVTDSATAQALLPLGTTEEGARAH